MRGGRADEGRPSVCRLRGWGDSRTPDPTESAPVLRAALSAEESKPWSQAYLLGDLEPLYWEDTEGLRELPLLCRWHLRFGDSA